MIDVVNNEYSNTEKLEYFKNKLSKLESEFYALGGTDKDLESDELPSKNLFNMIIVIDTKKADTLYKKIRYYKGRVNSTLYWIRRGYK